LFEQIFGVCNFVCIDIIFFFEHLIAPAYQTFNRNNRIHAMTSTMLFYDESESAGSHTQPRMRVYVCTRTCHSSTHSKFASNSSTLRSLNSLTLRSSIEYVRLKAIAANPNRVSMVFPSLYFFFLSDLPKLDSKQTFLNNL